MRPASDIIQPLTLADGTHIKCLQALSILDSEMASKAEHSAEAPLERWHRAKVPPWDLNRIPEPTFN